MRTIAEQTYLNLQVTSDISVLQGKTIDEILETVWPYIIPFTMQDGNGLTKKNVVSAVCRHYWMREIGLETVGLWKYAIGTRLQEIMPKYQEMALAQAEMGSIWESQNIRKFHSGQFTTEGNENGNSSTTKDSTLSATSSKDGTVSGKDGTISTESGETDSSRNGTQTNNDDKTITVNYGKVVSDKNTEWSDLHKEDIASQNTEQTYVDTDSQNQWHDMQNETNSNGSVNQKDKFSDTPQNGLTAVEEGMYLTNARIKDDTNTNHGTVAEHFNDSVNNNRNGNNTSTSSGNVKTTQNEGKNADGTTTSSGNDTTTDRMTTNGTTAETGKETMTKDGNVDFTTSRTTGETGKNNQTANETGSSTDRRDRTENGTDSYNDTWNGFQGDKVETMSKYNELYVNIYQLIIGEVAGFFMTIF